MKSLIKRAVSAILSCSLLASFFTAYAAETGENNMAELQQFGFYTINADYLKFLHDKDTEVYYSKAYHTQKKPFVGMIISLGDNL